MLPSVLSHTLDLLPASLVLAQAAPASPGGGLMSSLPMFAVIIGIFYFLLIRPQQQEAKRHQELLGSLKKGDQVVTASGLHGKVFQVGDSTVTIEAADKVRLTFDKAAVKARGGANEVQGSGSGALKKKEG